MLDSPWLPLLIFVARIGDVSVGTTRLIFVMRGYRRLAVLLGFIEVLIWVFAAGSVLSRLDHWINIFAYAGGFAAGNAVGMWLESRLAIGMNVVTFVSDGAAHAVAECLRLADICVTSMSGSGTRGVVAVCHAVVPRKVTPIAIRMAREVDPDVLVTVEDVRETTAIAPPWFPTGAGKTILPFRRRIAGRWTSPRRCTTGMNRPVSCAAVESVFDERAQSTWAQNLPKCG